VGRPHRASALERTRVSHAAQSQRARYRKNRHRPLPCLRTLPDSIGRFDSAVIFEYAPSRRATRKVAWRGSAVGSISDRISSGEAEHPRCHRQEARGVADRLQRSTDVAALPSCHLRSLAVRECPLVVLVSLALSSESMLLAASLLVSNARRASRISSSKLISFY